MNLTLSADRELVERAREYARERGTSLNQMIRDYLEKLVQRLDGETPGEEFIRLIEEHPVRSEPGFRFNRDEIHDRGI